MLPILIFLLLDAYFEYSLSLPFYSAHPLAFGILSFLIQLIVLSQFWLLFAFFKSPAPAPGVKETASEKMLLKIAFFSMGGVSFLFSACLFRDISALILLPFGLSHQFYGPLPSAVLLFISSALFSWAAFKARFQLDSPRIKFEVKDLPIALQGLKIIQLSDMHLGTGPALPSIKAMVERALSLKPDLIVLTGDIIDGMTLDIQNELNELANLRAKYGVYFVLGNHECYWNWQESVAELERRGIRCLLNRGERIEIEGQTLFIAGMNDPATAQSGGEGPIPSAPPLDSVFNLMLVHQPGFAKHTAKYPYHLQLSGHTHGGQFFPWNLVVNRMYEVPKGLGMISGIPVYVNQGSGYWGPPLRLGTQSEVTELTLVRKP